MHSVGLVIYTHSRTHTHEASVHFITTSLSRLVGGEDGTSNVFSFLCSCLLPHCAWGGGGRGRWRRGLLFSSISSEDPRPNSKYQCRLLLIWVIYNTETHYSPFPTQNQTHTHTPTHTLVFWFCQSAEAKYDSSPQNNLF